MPYRFLLIVSAIACMSCSASSSGQPIQVDQCKAGARCVVQGKLVATHGTGSIRDESGCIAVALPQFVSDTWNLKNVEALGVIYKAPGYPGLVTYKLLGREVDAEACYSGLVMFVDHIQKIPTAR